MNKAYLLVCVASVALAEAVAQADEGVVRHWAVEPMSDVMRLPDREPTDGVANGAVRIVMAKDEYEPGSFVVRAAKDLGKVRLELSAFRTADGKTLPAEALDLKFVKVWYQNRNSWYCYFGDNGRTLCPELLVNDEDLIRCDHKDKFNYAKLVEADGRVRERWIDPPYQFDHPDIFRPMRPNFRDAKTLQPVALPAGEHKQFFLTVRTEKDTAEGLYCGSVKLTADSRRPIAEIPVTVRVLPFVLPRPKSFVAPYDDLYIACYSPICWKTIRDRNGNDHELMLRQQEAMLKNAVAHGQNMHWIRGNVAKTNDVASVREAMSTVEAMNRAGMRTDVLLGGVEPLVRWWGRKSPITPEEARADAAHVVRCADAAFGHHNIYIGYGDEPGWQWLRDNRPVFLAFEDVGLKFILAGWNAIFAVNPFAMDWQNIGGSPEGGVALANKWNRLGMRTAWYAGHHVGPENPAFNRRQYGFSTYFGGYTAICNYENGFAFYNDNTPKYRRMNNVYGTGDGVLDTLQWEGFREGVDDIRYATALRELAQRALASEDGEVRRIGRKALAMFANYQMESEDLSRFRSRIVDYILAVRAKVGDPTPDKPFKRTTLQCKIPEGDDGDGPSPERWRWVRMHAERGEYGKALDEYLLRATNNSARVVRAYSGLVDPVAMEAAYLGGRVDILKAIVADISTRNATRTNQVYEACFTAGALLAGGTLDGQKDAWTRLDDEWREKVDDKCRLKAIDHVGQIMAREGQVERVKAFWEWRESRLKPSPRKRYLVTWSETPIAGPAGWDALKLEESAFDRKWKGDFSFLTTDVSTGNRGVDAAGVTDGKSGCVSMSAVADAWGLHFRFTDRTEDAKLIGIGAQGDGSYECYLAPGLRAPYACAIADVSRNGGVSVWNTTYNTTGWRRLNAKDGKQVRTSNVCKGDRVETYLSFSWSVYFSRIPDGSEPWEFESLRWGKHNSAWNGTHYVHGRNTWGLLDFKLTPHERAAIYRSLLLEAKNDPVVGDTVSYWKDPELGDPAFYEAVVKPEEDKVEAWKRQIVPEMDDQAALKLGVTALPAIRDFGYAIDRLRTRYSADRLCEER